MNPFKVSREDQNQQLLDAIRAQFFGGREGYPVVTKFFTRQFEPTSASSLLEIHIAFRVGHMLNEHRLLARKEVSGLNPIPTLMRHMAATFVAGLYHPHSLPKTWVHQYKWRIHPEGGSEEYIREFSPIHLILPGEDYIHFQEFHPNAVSLFSYLQTLEKREHLNRQDKRVLDLVSAELHHLHSLRDISVSLKDKDILSLDSLDRDGLLNDAYDDALVEWQAHFLDYKRPRAKEKGPHPVWTKELRNRIQDTMEEFADRFAARGDRLVITHGDFWSPNILLIFEDGVYRKVEFVDQHRVPYFDRGFDLGRLLFDGMYWYYNTRKPIYLEWNNHLLAIHRKRTGDKELHETVCFGLISRLFSKLHPESARDFNAERILYLCNVILKMTQQGNYELKA